MENTSAARGITEAANAAKSCLLPTKSRERYELVYKEFENWRLGQGVTELNEDVFLAFFMKSLWKSSTLWARYSMLKSTVQMNENVDISTYKKITAFLKRQNESYQPKKANVFTMQNVRTFLNDAPDFDFLLKKVVLVFGLHGACRCAELCNINTDDITDAGNVAVVVLRNTKTKKHRTFTVTTDCNSYALFKKYFNLRPKDISHKRFFIRYSEGKCTAQAIGVHTFSKMMQDIAKFLKLPDYKGYTGHCLRRSSATFLADSGVDISVLKRHGGWRCTNVVEGYIEESVENKIMISKQIFKDSEYANNSIAEMNDTESIDKHGDINCKRTNESIDTDEDINCKSSNESTEKVGDINFNLLKFKYFKKKKLKRDVNAQKSCDKDGEINCKALNFSNTMKEKPKIENHQESIDNDDINYINYKPLYKSIDKDDDINCKPSNESIGTDDDINCNPLLDKDGDINYKPSHSINIKKKKPKRDNYDPENIHKFGNLYNCVINITNHF